jgi:hypothetical protein
MGDSRIADSCREREGGEGDITTRRLAGSSKEIGSSQGGGEVKKWMPERTHMARRQEMCMQRGSRQPVSGAVTRRLTMVYMAGRMGKEFR